MSLDEATDLVKQQTLTRDAFLGGRLTVSQPAKGFRAGLDSVLLGAAVRADAHSLLDLGAGAGTAALVAMADLPRLSATLLEADAATAAIAALNLVANAVAERSKVLALDLTAPGRLRADAGLAADHFSCVIANPPFFDPGRGSAPTRARAGARHMDDAALDKWVKTAATHAAPGGEVIFIHVAEALPLLLAAFTQRFGAVTVLPLLPRHGEAASRVLIRGIKGSRAPFRLLAARAMHEAEGRGFRPEFDAIFRGTARLIW
ncbi:MAG TPA: methyltransferase [Devosia sp.]|jgi:tRNA1(Val) A37 N6-methylase TrmN6|uniref:tRNA1(Val) (adenine(37)-N6)-methyltransferase n=1 Tax=Devosia sp. TaxID=1871048 RepID=UPI002DDCF3DE|nr:methyltransferase [Devosia sp.]HEV2516769.1 methyltransferase [Devosia sp.]